MIRVFGLAFAAVAFGALTRTLVLFYQGGLSFVINPACPDGGIGQAMFHVFLVQYPTYTLWSAWFFAAASLGAALQRFENPGWVHRGVRAVGSLLGGGSLWLLIARASDHPLPAVWKLPFGAVADNVRLESARQQLTDQVRSKFPHRENVELDQVPPYELATTSVEDLVRRVIAQIDLTLVEPRVLTRYQQTIEWISTHKWEIALGFAILGLGLAAAAYFGPGDDDSTSSPPPSPRPPLKMIEYRPTTIVNPPAEAVVPAVVTVAAAAAAVSTLVEAVVPAAPTVAAPTVADPAAVYNPTAMTYPPASYQTMSYESSFEVVDYVNSQPAPTLRGVWPAIRRYTNEGLALAVATAAITGDTLAAGRLQVAGAFFRSLGASERGTEIARQSHLIMANRYLEQIIRQGGPDTCDPTLRQRYFASLQGARNCETVLNGFRYGRGEAPFPRSTTADLPSSSYEPINQDPPGEWWP